MNRINHLFQTKPGNILSVFFTAGFPTLHSTAEIIKSLDHAGADMIEIGIPFSDPMADGPVIQKSSREALKQGMNLRLLFRQLKDIRKETDIPLLMMGYLNPVIQYGIERFCSDCASTGIDGIILPDLPLDIFLAENGLFMGNEERPIRDVLSGYNLHNIFLVSPRTAESRIQKIDGISDGFIYLVSSSSTTGIKGNFGQDQISYFERIRGMNLKTPALIGFGISGHQSFSAACKFARGAIIGSAFVKMLESAPDLKKGIGNFVREIRGDNG